MRARSSVFAVTCLVGLVFVPFEAQASPVTHPGIVPPSQIPPSWIGPAASPSLSNLKPARETVGYQDQRRYGTSTTERTPLCISQNGWIGGAYVYRGAGQPDRAYCVVNDGSGKLDVDAPAFLLEPRAGVPQNWIRWSSAQLDPRGAAIVFEQDSGRQLRACAATEGAGSAAKTVYGYVGDDGRCYGVELDGFARSGSVVQALGDRKGYDSFMLLMKGEMTGDALLPSEGWLTVRNALLPRGVYHRVGHGELSIAPRIACRGKQGNDTWPGYLDESTKRCQLFTSYNGTTGRAAVADYEVVRYARCQTGSGSSATGGTLATADGACTTSSGKTQSFWPYRTGTMPASNGQYSTVAGKGYYLCGATKLSNGRKEFLGFTNMVFPHTSQLNGCTDGTNSAQAPRDNAGSATKVWIFPAPGDDRG